MKKSLFLLAFIFAILCSKAQMVVVVDLMKVPAGGDDTYAAIEKEWKKLHQSLVASKRMLSWQLYYVHNSGTASPYNYATVRVYENLASAMKGLTLDDIKKSFGEKYQDMLKKTLASRNLIYSEILANEMGIPSQKTDKYILVSWMNATDVSKYYEMEKKAYMPMHQAAIDNGSMNSWGVWSRIFNEDTSYQAVTVNGYTSIEQLSGMNYNTAIDKVKASKSTNEFYELVSLADQTNKLRTIVKSQLWELLEITQ